MSDEPELLSWTEEFCCWPEGCCEGPSSADWVVSEAFESAETRILLAAAFLGALRFLSFILLDSLSEARRGCGEVGRDTRAVLSWLSKSSKLSSLNRSSSSKESSSKRCLLLSLYATTSLGDGWVRSVMNPVSESKSDNDSKTARLPRVVAPRESNELVK